MVRFASLQDVKTIEADMPWPDSQPATTLYELLSQTTDRHGPLKATTFQMFSGPKDPAETLTWTELHARVTQAANMFRALGVQETDTVAYVLGHRRRCRFPAPPAHGTCWRPG